MTGFLMSFNSYKELINAKYSSESLRVQKKTLESVGAEWQQVNPKLQTNSANCSLYMP
jgi:hypothetical protein